MSTEEPAPASDSTMAYQTAMPPDTGSLVGARPNVQSFEDFYRAEFNGVLGLAFVLTGDHWIAEETAQDAFVAAFRRWKAISAYDSPGAWVRRVLCNQAVSVIRRRIREAKALVRLGGHARNEIVLDEGDESFWQAVRRLPPRQAQAIALYYLEDYSVAEIGGVLDCSEGTVKTHLSRGRQAVAQALHLEDPQ